MRLVRCTPVLLMTWSLAACLSVQSYEGEKLPPDEVARISGDPSVNAGSPLTLVLRKVDERTLSVAQTSVDVLPGKHMLLVDCRVRETRSVTRHSIEVEVYSGEHYHLTAAMAPGLRGCAEVSLQNGR